MDDTDVPSIAMLLHAAQDLYQGRERVRQAECLLKDLMMKHPAFHRGSGYIVAKDRTVWRLVWNAEQPQVIMLKTFDEQEGDREQDDSHKQRDHFKNPLDF